MKKSEFVAKLKRWEPEQALYTAVTLAEEAGVKWDPEEPELPERVVAAGYYIQPEGDPSRPDNTRIYKEAAARYNAYSRILSFARKGAFVCDTLDQERRRQEHPDAE